VTDLSRDIARIRLFDRPGSVSAEVENSLLKGRRMSSSMVRVRVMSRLGLLEPLVRLARWSTR
jgi:hypothetical protein